MRPDWVPDLGAIDVADACAASTLALVSDAVRVEPLAGCAQAVLAWFLRSDSLHEVKLPNEKKEMNHSNFLDFVRQSSFASNGFMMSFSLRGS